MTLLKNLLLYLLSLGVRHHVRQVSNNFLNDIHRQNHLNSIYSTAREKSTLRNLIYRSPDKPKIFNMIESIRNLSPEFKKRTDIYNISMPLNKSSVHDRFETTFRQLRPWYKSQIKKENTTGQFSALYKNKLNDEPTGELSTRYENKGEEEPPTIQLRTSNKNEIEKERPIISNPFLNFSIDYSTAIFNISRNIITSPISLATLMSMVRYGACGNARNVINSVLNLSPNILNNRTLIRNFIQRLLRNSNTILMGHKIFVPAKVELCEKYSQKIRDTFNSTLQQIYFTDKQKAAQIINEWSAKQTNNNVKDVVDSSQFNDETDLVLVSVAFFDCLWLKPFNPEYTMGMNFYINGQRKEVMAMKQTNKFRYGYLENFRSRYVELPLDPKPAQDPVKMIIILPDDQTCLSSFALHLSKSEFRNLILNDGQEVLISISLPKFKISSKIDFEDKIYQAEMGIDRIFSGDVKFGSIAESQDLKVSKFIQESVIDVNEGNYHQSNISTSEEWQSPIIFLVDRPFIVLITSNDIILACAKVYDPSL